MSELDLVQLAKDMQSTYTSYMALKNTLNDHLRNPDEKTLENLRWHLNKDPMTDDLLLFMQRYTFNGNSDPYRERRI